MKSLVRMNALKKTQRMMCPFTMIVTTHDDTLKPPHPIFVKGIIDYTEVI